MFYAVLAIIILAALFLIFRDDHDDSYNRNEKKAQRQSEGAKRQKTYTRTDTSQPKSEANSGHRKEFTSGRSSKPEVDFEAQAKKVVGVLDSIIEEVKKGTAEPMKDIQKGVQGVMDEAKAAIDKAMKEAGQKEFWTSSADVDEQEQPEPEEKDWEDKEGLDLSFLDTLEYDEDLEENTETFDVTGLRYHCTVHDCGPVVGIVRPEPDNVHDPRAQAVIRSDGKLLGYIPRTQLDWYEDFNEENVECPFVGTIELDRSSARLIAEIKVILPSSEEFVREEIEFGV
ncbi:MAG: hypothetical protein IJ152_04420 [Bacteroidales bacterium]|nr:hypothetical protein [Bacteroidales bacterium]